MVPRASGLKHRNGLGNRHIAPLLINTGRYMSDLDTQSDETIRQYTLGGTLKKNVQ